MERWTIQNGTVSFGELLEEPAEKEIMTFLLIGKTGNGKSATGNSLLKRPDAFRTSSDVTSETKTAQFSFAEIGDYKIMVVDGPGLEDTELDKVEDKQAAAKYIDSSLVKCYGSVDAFLLILKFGDKFTTEDKSTLVALKRILGDKYIQHVIVVVTSGDLFQVAMTEENRGDISFHQWCQQQKGEFLQLYRDCKGRFVLFNNLEKDEVKLEAQRWEIVQLARDLREKHGCYTSQCFQDADEQREQFILEQEAPHLKLKMQADISCLAADIEHLSLQPSESDRLRILARILDLEREIESQTKISSEFQDLLKNLEALKGTLHDSVRLRSLSKHLERLRQAKDTWAKFEASLAIASTSIFIGAPGPFNLLGAVPVGVGIIGKMAMGGAEKILERRETKIKRKQEGVFKSIKR